ncbi:hypothetical protein BsWGS_18283 [Bradybaena similaris]
MEDWTLAVIIVVPVWFAIIVVITGCCCLKYYTRKRSSVGGTNNCYVNHGIQDDVESQKEASSKVETETRTVDESLSVATIINEETVPHDSGIGRNSRKGESLDITNNNEAIVLHNFRTPIQIGEDNLSHDIHISQERVHHIFEPGIQIYKDNLPSVTRIKESTTNINEPITSIIKSTTSVNEERAAQRVIPDRGLGITPVRGWVEQSIDREQNLPSKLNSTNIQTPNQAKSTQRPASTLDARSVEQFTNAPRSNLNTSAGHQKSNLNTSAGHQKGNVNTSAGHQKSNVNTSAGHQQSNFNLSNAFTKNNSNKPIGYPTSNFNTSTGYSTSNFDTSTGYRKLDLHYYRLKDAMAEFKEFLETSIEDYRNSNYSRSKRFILVITGRGLHSPNGIGVIKRDVEGYLLKHGYTYNWSNPGMVRIDLYHSLPDNW